MSDPQQLLQEASRQLWSLLRELREELKADTKLASLTPLPGLESTPLAGLLQPVDNLSLTSSGAVLFTFARTLVSSGSAEGVAVRVHGWDPGGGQARSVALSAGTLEPAGDRIVIALASGDDGEVGLHILVNTAAEITSAAPTTGLSVTVKPSNHGQYEGWFGPKGAKQFTGNGTVDCIVSRVDNSQFLIGDALNDSGRQVQIAAQRMTFSTLFTFTSEPPQAKTTLLLERLTVNVFPEWLVPLVGGASPVIESLGVEADTQKGLHLLDGGTAVTLQANSGAPGLNIKGIDVSLSTKASTLNLRFGLRVRVSPPGIPLIIDAAGFGAELPFSIGADNGFGFQPEKMAWLPPEAIGADLTLDFASGGGALADFGNGSLGGALTLDLKFITINAFAVLQTKPPLSFVILMSVRFLPPGIQLGFGFSLTGIGGLVGINRRLDAQAIEAAILDGSINQLLFPSDPARNALQAIETLSRIFPIEPGHFVIGPVLELSWGGRLVTLVVAIIFDPPSFTILGRLKLALPDPSAPAVVIQATFAGRFDPEIPSTQFIGTLQGSHLIGLSLSGDLFVLAKGGPDGALVVSAGGFHPEYRKPSGIPALRRIGCDLAPPTIPWLNLRAEAYFAFTGTSVQFGAAVQLSATIAGCGVEGRLRFDALCRWSPRFEFIASCDASVAVQVFGETLAAVALHVTLEGPTPWRATGVGTVSVLIKDISLDFGPVQWGDVGSPLSTDFPKIEVHLKSAFERPTAWIADLPPDDRNVATLTEMTMEGKELLHPLSSLVARQQVIPLEMMLTRYQSIRLEAPEQWHISGWQLRPDQEQGQDGAPIGENIEDLFTMSLYLDRSEAEQLGGPAFEHKRSGKKLVANDPDIGPGCDSGPTFDPKVITAEPNQPPFVGKIVLPATMLPEFDLSSRNPLLDKACWSRPAMPRVKVAASQPMGLAHSDSLHEQSVQAGQHLQGYAHAAQMADVLRREGIKTAQLVERWELVHE